jgi:MFS family permease
MGVQSVLFAWLLTVALHETAEWIGIAQLLLNLPTLALVLFGGAVADRNDCRRLLMRLQFLIALPSFVLLLLERTNQLAFVVMCGYALAMGTLGAFLVPARDSLLNRVSGENVQRTVPILMLVQFVAQLFGQLLAGRADAFGAAPLLAVQCAVMLAAIYASYQLRPAPPTPRAAATHHFADIRDGLAEVIRSPSIAPVVLYMFTSGIATIGLYLVVVPLIVRDVYQGGSNMLAWFNICFMIGVALVSVALMRFGPVRRQGRALMLAYVGSVAVVLTLRVAPPEWLAYAAMLIWGVAAGFSMSMSRSLVQSAAPPAHRARILAAYQLGFMGGAPIGALANGYQIKLFGLPNAMLVAAAIMAVIWFATLALSRLWYLEPAEAAA